MLRADIGAGFYLEILLGLSLGYLSRLLGGTANPSPHLVAALLLLAKDPEQRLAELRRGWAEPFSLATGEEIACPQSL
jgi:hypothetical protein